MTLLIKFFLKDADYFIALSIVQTNFAFFRESFWFRSLILLGGDDLMQNFFLKFFLLFLPILHFTPERLLVHLA
jgi:hypothetical protein